MQSLSQSDGLLDEHLKKRVLTFSLVISMVVGLTIFNLKNRFLDQGSQRLPPASVIRKPPSGAPFNGFDRSFGKVIFSHLKSLTLRKDYQSWKGLS
jgi:hypothetical protein